MKVLFSTIFVLSYLVSVGQSTLPLRADTVLIEKTAGNGELKIKNSTRDSLGLMVNIGGGRTQFMRIRQLNDSTFIIPPYGIGDTIVIRGTGGGGGAWGTITGTLSDQTDLQGALDGKVASLDTSRASTTATITGNNGATAVLKLVDVGSNKAGLMSPADKSALDSLYLGLLEDSIIIIHAGDSGTRTFFIRNDSLFFKRINVVGGTITTNADSSITITISVPGGSVTGSGTSGQATYWTGTNSIGGEAAYAYNAANNKLTAGDTLIVQNAIGIGGTPGVKLDIFDYNASAERRTITNGTGGQMVWIGTDVATSYLGNGGNSGTYQGFYMGTNNNFPVLFFTGNVERVRINALGKVGIGVSPSYKLDILENDVGTITALRGINLRHLATISTVAAARINIGVSSVNSASISSGSNSLTNIGLYGSAKNGTFNYSAHMDTGTVQIGPIGVTDVSRRAFVNGSVGIHKDSIPLVTAMAANHIALIDTITHQIKRIALSSLGFLSSAITSINSQTGPLITIAEGTGIDISNTTNTVTVAVDPAYINAAMKDSTGYYTATATTTDATPTTITTIPVPAGYNINIEATCIAISNDGNSGFSAIKQRAFLRNASSIMVTGGIHTITADDATGSGFTTTTFSLIDSGGTHAGIQVTGEAATTVHWKIRYKILSINVNF